MAKRNELVSKNVSTNVEVNDAGKEELLPDRLNNDKQDDREVKSHEIASMDDISTPNILNLHDDASNHILSFLKMEEAAVFGGTCKRLHEIKAKC